MDASSPQTVDRLFVMWQTSDMEVNFYEAENPHDEGLMNLHGKYMGLSDVSEAEEDSLAMLFESLEEEDGFKRVESESELPKVMGRLVICGQIL